MTLVDEPAAPPTGSTPPSSSGTATSWTLGAAIAVVGAALALAIVGLLVLAVVAIASDDNGGGGGAGAAPTTIDVSLTEFSIDGNLVAAPGNVELDIINDGAIEHNLAVRGLGIESQTLQSRGSERLSLGNLGAGTYEVYCTIVGHEASGMVAELVVTDDAAMTESAGGMNHDEMTADELDMVMIESMLAFPAETDGVGNQLLEPEILADGTKRFVLTAEIIDWEVAPGQIVEGWAYNGQIPGPRIHVDVGDRIEVELTNKTPLGTDIHWHGVHTPNGADGVSPYTQDPIKSGDTYTYRFVADDPAIGMYHAHLHSQTSVVNGMFAVFQVGDDPIPYGATVSGVTVPTEDEIDLAFDEPMVLNDAGTIGLSLNGKSFPATAPIVMDQGQWGVIHYYNEGLTAHPMHLHQFPQLVYAKDGIPLDNPYWADTINVAPGERYSVMFRADTVGTWVYHCHILTHVEREEGMFGMVTAVVVNDPNAS